MKKILAILLAVSALLCLASCSKNGSEGETTVTEATNTEPPKKVETPTYDNAILNENGMINLTPSDYRIIDKTDDGYVILRMTDTGVFKIHKVIEYETTQDAIDFLVKITNDGTAKNYPELNQVANYFYYTIGIEDETYGRFFTMTRKDVLKAFGRDTETASPETDEHDHQH